MIENQRMVIPVDVSTESHDQGETYRTTYALALCCLPEFETAPKEEADAMLLPPGINGLIQKLNVFNGCSLLYILHT